MKPTPEQIKQIEIECGLTYTLADAKRFEDFFALAYELGRKDQRESDAQIAYPKNDKSDWTPEAEHAALIAELIRNNTGE